MDLPEYLQAEPRTERSRRMKALRKKTKRLVQQGRIPKPDQCPLCGAAEVTAHHRNEFDPFAVDWLCWACHRGKHRQSPPTSPPEFPDTSPTPQK